MTPRSVVGPVREAAGWVIYPAVPATLAMSYHRILSFRRGTFLTGADPRIWSWDQAYLLLGPLVGFAFLAGATLDLPDPPGLRGWHRVFDRRAAWVAVGPWWGALAVLAVAWAEERWPGARPSPPGWLALGLAYGACYGLLPAGWLLVAVAAMARARGLGRLGRAVWRGLATVVAFVGSLVGGFWAATELWRSYFFDPKVLHALMIAGGGLLLLGGLGGCAGTLTAGEVRRGDLYGAMLAAWVVGLALAWRWWGRPRPKGRG
jgi:hypothetical protein